MAKTDKLATLTPKERECLRLVGQRLSSKEIAAQLGIAKSSVDTYCDRARIKLGARDRIEAAHLLAAAEEPPPPASRTAVPAPRAPILPPLAEASASRKLLIVTAIAMLTVISFGSLIASLRVLGEIGFAATHTQQDQ